MQDLAMLVLERQLCNPQPLRFRLGRTYYAIIVSRSIDAGIF